MLTVSDETDLANQVIELLRNEGRRSAMGSAGAKFVSANRGSLAQVINLVEDHLK